MSSINENEQIWREIYAKFGNNLKPFTIHKIQWSNLYGFDKESIINFDETMNLQIFGDNASGKSSIFNIILFAIYGAKMGTTNNPVRLKLILCNKNSANGYSKCWISVDSRKFLITRIINRKFTSECEIINLETNERVDEKTMGIIDRETFCSINLMKQNRVQLMDKSGTDIEKVLNVKFMEVTNCPAYTGLLCLVKHIYNGGHSTGICEGNVNEIEEIDEIAEHDGNSQTSIADDIQTSKDDYKYGEYNKRDKSNQYSANLVLKVDQYYLNFSRFCLNDDQTKEISTMSKQLKILKSLFAQHETAIRKTINLEIYEIADFIIARFKFIIENFDIKNCHILREVNSLYELSQFYLEMNQTSIDEFLEILPIIKKFNKNSAFILSDLLKELQQNWCANLRKVVVDEISVEVSPLKIFYCGKEYYPDVLSGFQKLLLDITFRIASGANFLFIDEGFGCCDDVSLDRICHYLAKQIGIPVFIATNINLPYFERSLKIEKNKVTFGQSQIEKTIVDSLSIGEQQDERNTIGNIIVMQPDMSYHCLCCEKTYAKRVVASKHLTTISHLKKFKMFYK